MRQPVCLITLGVHDLPRAKAFYETAFGYTASSASNDAVVFFDTGGAVLGLYGWDALAEDAHVDPKGDGFRGVSLAHNARSKEAVDTAIQRAVNAGATLVKPAQDVFWGGYSGYVADSDGHLWEIAWNPFFPLDENGLIQLPV